MAAVDLVCFHHAGGGSASFQPLRRALADLGSDVTFTVATLPGRELRRTEPRHTNAAACVRALADELDDRLNGGPHVLLGHSMGALLAYSLAQQRIAEGRPPPEAVIVASSLAPRSRALAGNLGHLDDHQLATRLARHGGVPAEVLEHPDWLALLMPTVRDDLQIVQSHQSRNAPMLPCPLHVLGGVDDPLAPPDELKAWRLLSLQPQPVRLYSGGHFIFRTPEPSLVTTIDRITADAALQRSDSP